MHILNLILYEILYESQILYEFKKSCQNLSKKNVGINTSRGNEPRLDRERRFIEPQPPRVSRRTIPQIASAGLQRCIFADAEEQRHGISGMLPASFVSSGPR